MIDTVLLQIPTFIPLERKFLKERGFNQNQSYGHTYWIKQYNSLTLMYKLARFGAHKPNYLQVQGSLPRFYFGQNLGMLNDTIMPLVLDNLSDFASSQFGVPFNALIASVQRVDYCYNFQLPDEFDVLQYLRFIKDLPPPAYRRTSTEASTVYFLNDSICSAFYAKHEEMKKSCKNNADAVKQAQGVLRFEYRLLKKYRCDKLAKEFGVENTAGSLLTEEMAKAVLSIEKNILGLDGPVVMADNYDNWLRSKIPDLKDFRELRNFTRDCQFYGAHNLRKEGIYTTNPYYRLRKLAMKYGVWNIPITDVELPLLGEISYDISLASSYIDNKLPPHFEENAVVTSQLLQVT
jgi:hypothetical protein